VPEGDQVRIERYSAPGRSDRFVVYVGPTETFDPKPKGEPWDLASNVGGVGGIDVGSIRATELAMKDAGIAPGSEVQLVGFSQGGMVATRIAGDGHWNAVGLQTFGAPAGNVALPDGIQGMAVRNSEDFVPALAGPQVDDHLLQVQRTVYADPAQMPTDQAAPGHQRVAYAATAQAIDAARSGDVRAQSDALDAFTGDYADQPGSTGRVKGRRMMPISQLMTPMTIAPSTPQPKLPTCRPNPIDPLIQATSSRSSPLTTSEMRPSVMT
jgi:hypothetical protein